MAVFTTNKLPGRSLLTAEGKEYLWFGGTDYLGMGHNPHFRQYLNEGIDLYGMHYGSSRNSSVQLAVFEETEQIFADFVQAEAALLTSSGMLAGRLAMLEIESIVSRNRPGATIKYNYAANTHPAIRGAQYVSDDRSWKESIEDIITKINHSAPETAHIICSDATGSPFAAHYDFSAFGQIQHPENVFLIVDQSHTLGVLGESGNGIGSNLPVQLLPRTLFVSSLNKALGIPAGAIWGARQLVDELRLSPWFSGASPSAPAYVYAFHKLLKGDFYQKALADLRTNISGFLEKLKKENLFSQLENYPVFCSMNAHLHQHLIANDVLATHFSYPSPADPPVTRIVISALHQQKDLDQLAEVCNAFQG